MKIAERLKLLRAEMQAQNIDIYIVPSIDAHNSEYVPVCWERRAWISNFDGSAGEVLITLDHAYLWTDGRYFLQANQQLDSNYYTLMKQSGFAPEIEQWLLANARGKRLGIDPQLISINRAQQLKQLMQTISGELVLIEGNLVDRCRAKLGEDLTLPIHEAFTLSEAYTGQSVADRLAWLKDDLTKKGADFIALNVLDEIAWLFNLRGTDIAYNPLVIAYAIVGQANSWIFIDERKITPILHSQLKAAGVISLDYAQFGEQLKNLTGKICLDEKTATQWMLEQASNRATVTFARSPIVLAKACKNSVEAEGARIAHIKDAVAMINFLCWLEHHWQQGVDEISCAEKLADFRAQQQSIQGSSFATISGFASNGAIIHYRANLKTNKIVNDSNLYLLDSGGQYLDGTTDITRTIHLGEPTAKQKFHYTLVLQGHLALARAKFPHGTCGEHLDVLARASLWQEHLNYYHGTGHGVGSFLCVHEGPQKISPMPSGIALLPGMIVSNEPGLYIEGNYGIRIENLLLINPANSSATDSSDFGPFYQFEDLTLVPYCKSLIDWSVLNDIEKRQIQNYYATIKHKVRELLGPLEQAWLDGQLSFN